MISIIIGVILGYIIGITIWEKIILPKLEKQKRKEEYILYLQHIEVCKIIGNPKNEHINL